MDELTLLAEREENPSPAGIMAAAVTAALAICVLFFAPAVFARPASDSLGELLVGKAAFGDWRTDAPLVRRKITDLPPPYATRSASNPPRVIAKPASAAPRVPPGFQVELFASNLRDPRTVRVAPNGDIFIAESEPGRIRVLRAADGAVKPSSNDVFASGLDQPFGIAFYPSGSDPQWIYVANTGAERSPALPNVPTSKEAGLPEFNASAWNALFAPKGTPKAALDMLTDGLDKALDDESVRNRLLDLGCDIPAKSKRGPQSLAALVTSEIARWTPIIKAASIKAE